MSSREDRKRQAREEREKAEQAAAAADQRKRRLQLLASIAAVAVVIVVVAVVISTRGGGSTDVKAGKPASGGPEVQKRFAGIPQGGMTLGKPTAPVTMVEYIDLKCPVCQAFETSVFPTLVDKYVRTGKLRVQAQLQDFVGNEEHDSEDAARMGLAVSEQNTFFQFASLFYMHQGNEQDAYVTDSFLRSIGDAVQGLDVQKALDARQSSQVSDQLQKSSNAFDQAGFTGTPSFQIGKTGTTLRTFNPSSFTDSKDFEDAINQLAGAQ